MSSELIEQLKRNSKEKQLIELKLQEQELIEARELVDLETQTKRKSERIENIKKNKIIKINAIDNIKIRGLKGTLGENLIRLASNITIQDARSRYFSYLSKNSIIDISNTNKESQIDLLGGAEPKQFFKKFTHESKEKYLLNNPFIFNQVDGARSLKRKYEEIDIYSPKNKEEIILKKICVHILYLCVYNPLTEKYLQKCSEQTLIIRFWGSLFEYYFGTKEKIFLQWGDTISLSCKESNLNFKLDIRLSSEKDEKELDVLNGEVASIASSNKRKYYKDALKLALSTKQHLNLIVSSLNNLTVKELPNLKLPIIQIMGLNLHISSLHIVDKNIYILQNIYSFNYPRTIKEIKEGAIERIMTGFLIIDNMISDLDDIYNNCLNEANDKIELIINEKKQKKTNNCRQYISVVDWDSDEDVDYDNN